MMLRVGQVCKLDLLLLYGCVSFALENQLAEAELVEVVAASALDRLCLRQAQATASFSVYLIVV